MQIPKRSIHKKSFILDALEYLEKGQEVPQELINAILENFQNVIYLAQAYLEFNKEVPQELIDAALKNPWDAFILAQKYVTLNKEVPQKLIDEVSNDTRVSRNLIREYLENNQNVPQKLFEPISKDSFTANDLAFAYLKKDQKVPQVLINAVSKHPQEAANLAQKYLRKNKEVPQELIDAVSKNPRVRLNIRSANILAQEFLKYNKEVPQKLIDAVLQDFQTASSLALTYLRNNKEVPQELSSNLLSSRSVDILTKEELQNLGVFINNGAVQLPKSIEDLPKKLQKQYSSIDDPKLQAVLFDKIPEKLKEKMKELGLPVELESLTNSEVREYIEKSIELQHLPSFSYTSLHEDRTRNPIGMYYSEPRSGKHGRVYVHAPELPPEITKVFDLHNHSTPHFIGWIAWFENTLEDGRKVFQIWEIQSDLLQGTQQLDLKQYGKGKPILDEQGELIEENIDPQYSVKRVKEIKDALAKYKQEHGKSLKNVLENQYRNWPALFLNEAFKEAKRLGYEWVGIELIHQNRPDLKKVYEYISHYPIEDYVKTKMHNPESYPKYDGEKVDVALLRVDQIKTASRYLMEIAKLIKGYGPFLTKGVSG